MKAIDSKKNEGYMEYINRILNSRPNKKIEIGQHRHHIIPKSLGGTNSPENLIWLFASEHAKAHYLYSKENPNNSGMAYAASVLCSKNGDLLTNDEIDWLSKHNSELQSERVMGEKIQCMESITLKNLNEKMQKNKKVRLQERKIQCMEYIYVEKNIQDLGKKYLNNKETSNLNQ